MMNTKAPETIWAVFEPHPNPKDNPPYVHASASETKGLPYIHRDHAQALVAAAYRAAASYLYDEKSSYPDEIAWCIEDEANAICDLTPDDAKAALENVKREARIEAADRIEEAELSRAAQDLGGWKTLAGIERMRVEELEAEIEGAMAIIAAERAEVLGLRRKLTALQDSD